MQINVKVNEKDLLEETYTITLDRDEIEQVEHALLDQGMNIMTLIESARGEQTLDLVDEHLELRHLEQLIDRVQLSHLFIGENTNSQGETFGVTEPAIYYDEEGM